VRELEALDQAIAHDGARWLALVLRPALLQSLDGPFEWLDIDQCVALPKSGWRLAGRAHAAAIEW
jgi:hypothetical protein